MAFGNMAIKDSINSGKWACIALPPTKIRSATKSTSSCLKSEVAATLTAPHSYLSTSGYGVQHAAVATAPRQGVRAGLLPVAPALQTPVARVNRKPIRMGLGSGSGSPTHGGYGSGGFLGSPLVFQVNRYTNHAQTQPISHPNSGSARSIGIGVASEFDVMHDLNGTLESLYLDRKRDQEWEREREFVIGEWAWSLKSLTVTCQSPTFALYSLHYLTMFSIHI
ncbi:hypothetical protein B0H14DRAFT_2610383 [Mycena olivaceomarginata]|nr:hypothetical protein B0H14DRAFT_2610383 [Mycena olivaceomarginata]